MNERIKELAEQAGLEELGDSDWCSLNHPDVRAEHLERFADLVRQDEREACARLCESMGVHPALNVWGGGPEWYKRQKECAAAIRARGNT
jgi:hypothetical protein